MALKKNIYLQNNDCMFFFFKYNPIFKAIHFRPLGELEMDKCTSLRLNNKKME